MIRSDINASKKKFYKAKKTLSFILIYSFILLGKNSLFAQGEYTISNEDSLALENVIVEKYYEFTQNDYADTIPDSYPIGAITYRIYIDMKPGYALQAVYGIKNHGLFIKTSTSFFNDSDCYAKTGFNIDAKKLHIGAVALDSWITMGAASRVHTGILRSEDDSVFSFIQNRKSFSKGDGLTTGKFADFQLFNIDLNCFYSGSDSNNFSTSDGAWAALGGVYGPTPANRVLIAQLTTTGKLSFSLNVQIGTPTGGTVQFVAQNPEGSEILFESLNQN